ncbi:hypothetical protein BJV77DRAFT_642083 [Russula vinacea]|nr:hypothetical protein BJV77DRAFT_642083 [Russula vinacea]
MTRVRRDDVRRRGDGRAWQHPPVSSCCRCQCPSPRKDLGLRPTSMKIRSWGRDAATCPSIETCLRNSSKTSIMGTIGNWQAARCKVGYYCSGHGLSLSDRCIHSRVMAPIFLYAGLLDSSHRDSSAGGRIGFSSGGGALVYPYPYLRVRRTVVTVLYCNVRNEKHAQGCQADAGSWPQPSESALIAPHRRACLGIEASRHHPILQTSRSGHAYCSS